MIKTTLQATLYEVQRAVYGYRQRLAEVEPFVLKARKHSRDLHNQADIMKKLVACSQ